MALRPVGCMWGVVRQWTGGFIYDYILYIGWDQLYKAHTTTGNEFNILRICEHTEKVIYLTCNVYLRLILFSYDRKSTYQGKWVTVYIHFSRVVYEFYLLRERQVNSHRKVESVLDILNMYINILISIRKSNVEN